MKDFNAKTKTQPTPNGRNNWSNAPHLNDGDANQPLFTSKDAGLTYTIAVICLLLVSLVFSVVVSSLEIKSGLPHDEYFEILNQSFAYKLASYLLSSLSILLTIFAVSYYKKQRPFKGLAFKRTGWKYYLIAPVLAFGLLFGFGELNNLFIEALDKIGLHSPPVTLPNDKWWQFATWIVVVAILPAIFEECLFRGYILEGLKGYGVGFVTVIGGLFFSLFHQNPQQTPYQFLCGAVYFLFAIKCGSIYPAMLMHLINNLFIITSDFFKWTLPPTVMAILAVLGIIAVVACCLYLIFDKSKEDKSQINPLNQPKSHFFIYSLPGVAVCVIMWVLNFFS